MPTKRRRQMVQPEESVYDLLGTSATALGEALECWATALRYASADNAKTFTAAEWCMMADANNGSVSAEILQPEAYPGSALLWANVADHQRLNAGGAQWFGKQADKRTAALVEKLQQLDYVHTWAAILALRWFWDHADLQIDAREEPWWTVEYRREKSCE